MGPLRIFATVEASSIKFCTQIGFGSSLPKTTIRTKISGGRARGASKQIWDPERISAAVEASNFKFGRPTKFGLSNLVGLHKFGLGQAY